MQNTLGNRVKQARKFKILTSQELSDMIDIDRSFLSKIENDKYKPSEKVLRKLAEALDVNVVWLAHGTTDFQEFINHK